jgi:hypothetical protein
MPLPDIARTSSLLAFLASTTGLSKTRTDASANPFRYFMRTVWRS